MSKQKKQHTEDEVLVDVGQSLSSAEHFFEENRKSITFIAVALFVIVGGYFAYLYLYQTPREKEAQEYIFAAQNYFEQDDLTKALEGDGQNYGFIDIANDYSGTKAGNLANYYAGISYLNNGEFENAIEYLDNFSSDDPILSVIATGSIGDAFMELGQPSEALDYYQRATSGESNEFVVPFYLKKAGMVAEELGEYNKANKFYTRIKKEFKDSQEGSGIDKFIARVETKMNK